MDNLYQKPWLYDLSLPENKLKLKCEVINLNNKFVNTKRTKRQTKIDLCLYWIQDLIKNVSKLEKENSCLGNYH
jgi:hypothetical protein